MSVKKNEIFDYKVKSKDKDLTVEQESKPSAFDFIYFVFFLVLPLIYSAELIDPVLIPRQILLTAFVLLISMIITHQIYFKKIKPDFSFLKLPLSLVLFLFLITIALSFTQAYVISESLYVLSKTLIGVLFFIVTTYLLIQKNISLYRIAKSIVAFIILSTLIGIYQLIISDGDVISVKSTIANKNLFASLIFLSFPFIFIPLLFSKKRKILSVLFVVPMLVLLWVLQSKAVLIASLIFFLILIFTKLFIFQKNRSERNFIKPILFISIPLIIIAVTVTFQNKQFFTHLFNTNTISTRLMLWENSEKIIEENFFGGVGAGNWKIHFPKHGLNKFNAGVQNGMINYQRPHNDYLWVFAEQGALGLVIYLFIFLLILYYLLRIIKGSPHRKDKFTYLSFLACIMGYMFISFVDYPLERIEHQILLYLIFSITAAKYYHDFIATKTSKGIVAFKPILPTIALGVIVFSFVVSLNRYSGEYYTSKLYKARHQGNFGKMIKLANKAINPFYVIDPMSIPINWYKGVALFSLAKVNKAKTVFETAYGFAPFNIHVLNNLASCYESLGEHNKAEETYLKALSISAQFEEALLNLSAVYFNMKEYEEAFETINKCNIKSTDPKYRTFLPAILSSKIDIITSGIEDENLVKKLKDLKSFEDKLLKTYFDSKKENITYNAYLNQYAL